MSSESTVHKSECGQSKVEMEQNQYKQAHLMGKAERKAPTEEQSKQKDREENNLVD